MLGTLVLTGLPITYIRRSSRTTEYFRVNSQAQRIAPFLPRMREPFIESLANGIVALRLLNFQARADFSVPQIAPTLARTLRDIGFHFAPLPTGAPVDVNSRPRLC
ncbi:hypothetical protein RO07_23875 [Pandoraea pulmonicola]|uniref:Uncharacterized protein n=1 Tax=Pandoraea pulmonicola TaxID=93221 RepID=A0ABN4F8Q4_PANPU|nr:hypothetical protein RO07_23875 [Pandoraea pulmonicola]